MAKTIAFDLRALQIGHQNRGIGMAVRNIIEHLNDKENTYIFYRFDTSDPIKDLGIAVPFEYSTVTTPHLRAEIKRPQDILNAYRLSHHRFTPLKSLGIDTFVQFDHNLGLPRKHNMKKVLLAYDLIPLIFRNTYLPTARYAFSHSAGKKMKIKAVLRALHYTRKAKIGYANYRKADAVIAISETVKQSFIDLLHVPAHKISIAPLAPAAEKSGLDDTILNKLGIGQKPYILYVGGTDSRKRVQDIIHAFNISNGRGSDISLVLAGNEFKKVEDIPDIDARNAIMHSPYKDKIKLAGYVTDQQKNSLYKHAHAFVFASLYEGFGLPVIEANAKGCPVIAYDNSATSETAGDAALLVESGNYIKLAEAIGELFHEGTRKKLIKNGLKNATRYSWVKTSKAFKSKL